MTVFQPRFGYQNVTLDPLFNLVLKFLKSDYSVSSYLKKYKTRKKVISERSVARKKEFVMQCSINDKIATGMGPNKKTAKKNAAENMLR